MLRRQIRDHRVEHRKPLGVTRRRPLAVVSTAPSVAQDRNALGIERAAGKRRVALGIDAFGEPQPHQQEFVGDFARGELLVDDEAVAGASTRISQVSGRFSVSVA